MAYARNNTANPVNPVKTFLTWKGKDSDGFFSSYDKVTKTNNKEDLNNFIIIDTGYTVKGGKQMSDGSYVGYFSNEIKSFDETIRVMMNGGVVLAEGYYSAIKDQVKSEGGQLNLCITYLDLNDGLMKEFFLKGQAFFDFSEKILKKGQGKVISYDGANLVKGKAFNYNEPKFSITEDVITEEQNKIIDRYSEEVDEYYGALREKYGTNNIEKKEYAKPNSLVEGEVNTELEEPTNFKLTEEQKAARGNKINEDTVSLEDLPF